MTNKLIRRLSWIIAIIVALAVFTIVVVAYGAENEQQLNREPVHVELATSQNTTNEFEPIIIYSQITTQKPNNAPMATIREEKVAKCAVEVKDLPSVDGNVVGMLDMGDKVCISESDGIWDTILYNGGYFYVDHSYLITQKEFNSVPRNCYTEVFEYMSESDYEELAKSLWMEAGNSSLECRIATCEVYLNRCLSSKWGDGTLSVYAVIHQRGQFETTPWIKGVADGQPFYKYGGEIVDLSKSYEAIEYCRNNGRTLLEEDFVFFATFKANGHDFIKYGGHWFGRGNF